MLQVSNLTCDRGSRELFSALTFNLQQGEGLQVVGGNGRGKSTLLRILVGLYTDFEGTIDWSIDQPPLFLGHRIGVKNGLTVAENLDWQASLRSDLPQRESIDNLLMTLGLGASRNTRCASLSEGQRKRVSLAQFLLFDHSCWLLDEPFSALDQEGQVMLRTAMDRHIERGGALMFTSHQPVNLASPLHTLELG